MKLEELLNALITCKTIYNNSNKNQFEINEVNRQQTTYELVADDIADKNDLLRDYGNREVLAVDYEDYEHLVRIYIKTNE